MAKKNNEKAATKKTAASVPGKKATKLTKATDGKAKTAAPRPSYDRSHKQVAYDIMAAANGPMNAKQISDIMVSDGQISGKTPQATVGRDLCMNPELFAKVARGRYVAIKYVDDPNTAQVILGHKQVGTTMEYIKAYKNNGGKAPALKAPKQVPSKEKVKELLAEQKAKETPKKKTAKPKKAAKQVVPKEKVAKLQKEKAAKADKKKTGK